jgi:hypothetical protein
VTAFPDFCAEKFVVYAFGTDASILRVESRHTLADMISDHNPLGPAAVIASRHPQRPAWTPAAGLESRPT